MLVIDIKNKIRRSQEMSDNQGNYLICSKTGKIIFTEREAGEIVNGCRRHKHSSRRNRENRPARKYYCKYCRRFHLTHVSTIKKQA